MAKIRVYELAKKLNMTNKALLSKLKAMNIDVKSHMSSLEDEDVDRIKESLFGKKNKATEVRVRGSVIRRRRNKSREIAGSTEPSPSVESEEAAPEPERDLPEPEAVASESKPDSVETPAVPVSPKEKEPSPYRAKILRPAVKPVSTEQLASPKAVPEIDSAAADQVLPLETESTDISLDASQAQVSQGEKEDDTASMPESVASGEIIAEVPAATGIPEEEAVAEGTVEEHTAAGDAAGEEGAASEGSEPEPTVDSEQHNELPEKQAAEPVGDAAKAETEKVEDTEKAVKPKRDLTTSDKPENQLDPKDKKRKKKQKQKKSEPAKIIRIVDLPGLPSQKDQDKPVAAKPVPDSPPRAAAQPYKPVDRIGEPPASPRVVDLDIGDQSAEGKAKRKKDKKKRGLEAISADLDAKKSGFKKRKAVIEGKDLYEKGGRGGKKGRKKEGKAKKNQNQKTQITVPKAIKRRIKIDETIELAELAKRMGIKANEMIQKLMGLGVMATVNQTIDYDTAALVAAEFEYEVEKMAMEEDIFIHARDLQDSSDTLIHRPPVVTIMGHVDHGKTSLLDVIRKSKIVTGEAGGITQHIGAYSVETTSGKITFLDTPGHAAFTSMRSRGAKVTDLVVLVVAADDGVMPQTVEAINHSKAAGVPVVVAVNKMDKPGADPERVMRELADHGLVAEEWGGDAIFAKVSAKAETGIKNLLEMILLQAEVLELKANPNRMATGHVIESRLDAGRGPVATILVEQGTLRAGQAIVCGLHAGRIRAMIGDTGENVAEAGPSTPVEVVGLNGVPEAGDEFVSLESEKDAKQISDHRMQKQRAKELAKKSRANLEKLFENMGAEEIKELKLIVKADVHGSIEALNESIMKLAQDEVSIKIVHSGTGAINESDVSLAAVSDAIIIGFNVRPSAKVRLMAKEENVDMRFYDIIYNVINDIKAAITGLMPSTFHEIILGTAEVRDTFVIPNKGTIAGSFVQEGKFIRGEKIRLIRDGVVKCDTVLSSLRRFKDDVKEVAQGYECGIGIDKFNDIKVGDIFECYEIEERRAKMEQVKE